ncbi:MAG: nucleotide pyrophosphohydrolase [Chloroflexi bacterium]|nr:nucleotide pyrophosphohydrolase [Chloroflexota bacterium]
MSDVAPSRTLADLTAAIIDFRDARDWEQFHRPKDLALSVAIEAGELLELFQWKRDEEITAALADPAYRRRLGDEIADVLIYLLTLCHQTGLDPLDAAFAKLARNNERYPVERARGSSEKAPG